MALSENTSSQSEKSSQETTKTDKREKPLTKVIIRRLPPAMTQSEFLIQVSPVPDYDYIYSIKGDMSLGENSFARVYLNFCNTEDVYIFKEKFDNYVFLDAKGHEYPAVVEYSSFQKVPKRRKPRPDPKIGSIESDPIYQEFLESLKEQPNQEEKPEYSFQPSTENKNNVSTPLLDYLKQRKVDRLRIREEKREERRKKEIERKKMRDDDRRRRIEDKITSKSVSGKHGVVKEYKDELKTESRPDSKAESSKQRDETDKSEDKVEKSSYQKIRERKFEERERKFEDRKLQKPKYSSKYDDKKDYKSKRDDYRDYHRSKYDEAKKFENKDFSKRVKKYSERREERKIEASREEYKKEEKAMKSGKGSEFYVKESEGKCKEREGKGKENEGKGNQNEHIGKGKEAKINETEDKSKESEESIGNSKKSESTSKECEFQETENSFRAFEAEVKDCESKIKESETKCIDSETKFKDSGRESKMEETDSNIKDSENKLKDFDTKIKESEPNFIDSMPLGLVDKAEFSPDEGTSDDKKQTKSDDECDGKHRNKENDPRMQRRIRNKDRPAMVLYKPGMLRKKSVDNDKDSKDGEKEKSSIDPE